MLSDAATGEELAVIECASITSLRTGAAAAVSAQVLAREDASTVGIIGCGVNGALGGPLSGRLRLRARRLRGRAAGVRACSGRRARLGGG